MNTLSPKSNTQSTDAADSPPFRSAQTPDEVAAQSSPPSGNTGGKFMHHTDPETGENFFIALNGSGHPQIFHVPYRSPSANPYSAITDYLNITFQFEELNTSVEEFFQRLLFVLGAKFSPAMPRRGGMHGYRFSYDLGASTAIFAVGGQRGTGLLSMPGSACSLIKEWDCLIKFFRGYLKGRITRWDGAVDDFDGEHSVDYAAILFQSGMFNAGGNKPTCTQNGNWLEPDGNGRTLNIGRRKNGKMIRIYEKGMQLGAPWHPWVRWEVELHNVDRIIPWEVLIESGKFFVGSYPKALGWVQEDMTRIRTIKNQCQIAYDVLVDHASVAYGTLMSVMLKVEGSPEAVLDRLKREGVPRRIRHPYIDDQPQEIISAAKKEPE